MRVIARGTFRRTSEVRAVFRIVWASAVSTPVRLATEVRGMITVHLAPLATDREGCYSMGRLYSVPAAIDEGAVGEQVIDSRLIVGEDADHVSRAMVAFYANAFDDIESSVFKLGFDFRVLNVWFHPSDDNGESGGATRRWRSMLRSGSKRGDGGALAEDVKRVLIADGSCKLGVCAFNDGAVASRDDLKNVKRRLIFA